MELHEIKAFVEKQLNIFDIESKAQQTEFVFARNLYMWLADKYTEAIQADIGKVINKNHATVNYANLTIGKILNDTNIKGVFLHPKKRKRVIEIELNFLEFLKVDVKKVSKYHSIYSKVNLIIEHSKINQDDNLIDKLEKSLDKFFE